NRGSTFYLILYWAQALASQDDDAGMKARFAELVEKLAQNEARINEEILAAQGRPVDLGGYYMPSLENASQVMRPSAVLNEILDKF
ncbi:MAG: NADP-dependent isocitrate dehydrogenase, partial [bacterium]|nr:NADP-dependent isocitrate dehydrogenase [bacterium]